MWQRILEPYRTLTTACILQSGSRESRVSFLQRWADATRQQTKAPFLGRFVRKFIFFQWQIFLTLVLGNPNQRLSEEPSRQYSMPLTGSVQMLGGWHFWGRLWRLYSCTQSSMCSSKQRYYQPVSHLLSQSNLLAAINNQLQLSDSLSLICANKQRGIKEQFLACRISDCNHNQRAESESSSVTSFTQLNYQILTTNRQNMLIKFKLYKLQEYIDNSPTRIQIPASHRPWPLRIPARTYLEITPSALWPFLQATSSCLAFLVTNQVVAIRTCSSYSSGGNTIGFRKLPSLALILALLIQSFLKRFFFSKMQQRMSYICSQLVMKKGQFESRSDRLPIATTSGSSFFTAFIIVSTEQRWAFILYHNSSFSSFIFYLSVFFLDLVTLALSVISLLHFQSFSRLRFQPAYYSLYTQNQCAQYSFYSPDSFNFQLPKVGNQLTVIVFYPSVYLERILPSLPFKSYIYLSLSASLLSFSFINLCIDYNSSFSFLALKGTFFQLLQLRDLSSPCSLAIFDSQRFTFLVCAILKWLLFYSCSLSSASWLWNLSNMPWY